MTADIVGKYFDDNWAVPGWGENVYTIINPSITYRGFKKLNITVGASNVLDNRPPALGWRAIGFEDRLYGAGALGASVYVRVKKEF